MTVGGRRERAGGFQPFSSRAVCVSAERPAPNATAEGAAQTDAHTDAQTPAPDVARSPRRPGGARSPTRSL